MNGSVSQPGVMTLRVSREQRAHLDAEGRGRARRAQAARPRGLPTVPLPALRPRHAAS